MDGWEMGHSSPDQLRRRLLISRHFPNREKGLTELSETGGIGTMQFYNAFPAHDTLQDENVHIRQPSSDLGVLSNPPTFAKSRGGRHHQQVWFTL